MRTSPLRKTDGHELVMSQGSCHLNYLDFLIILEKNDLELEMTFNVLSLAQFILFAHMSDKN